MTSKEKLEAFRDVLINGLEGQSDPLKIFQLLDSIQIVNNILNSMN